MKELLKEVESFYYEKVIGKIREVGIINAFYAFFIAILSFFLWRS